MTSGGSRGRRFRDRPIREKISILIALASIAGLGFAIAAVTAYDIVTYRDQALAEARTLSEIVRANVTSAIEFGDSAAATQDLTALESRREVARAAIYDTNGVQFAMYNRPGGPAGVPYPPRVEGYDYLPDRVVITTPLRSHGRTVGWLRMHYSYPRFTERLPQYGIAMLVVLLALGTAAFLLQTTLRRSVSYPLLELADTARQLSTTSDLAIRVKQRSSDEIGALTAAFNSMLDSLQERDNALRRGAAELRESEARLRLALSAATMQLWLLRPDEAALTAFLRSVHEEDRAAVRTAIERATADGAAFDVEFRTSGADGPERQLALRGQGQAAGDGRPGHLIGVLLDVTERRGLERQLIQAQKMEAIGNLAGGIAHDFNNLLTGMIGHLKFAQRALPAGTQVRSDVDEVERAARRAAELTSQLLSYARRQMIMPTIVNLNDAVLALEPMLRRLLAENITIDIDLAPDLWRTRVDAGQLEQVLVNLAVNARDAMPDGGTLRIATRNVREDARDAGDFAEVLIEDSGIGMSADVLSRIFDPFFTTKPVGQGTGLGLAMCYGIVKQADAYIAVNSELGIGTTFRVRLPRAAEVSPLASVPASDAGETPGGSETILLAEDDVALRELAARTLREAGYRVLEAEDGFEAQALAGQHGNGVDMLLTDVVMPRQSGRELAAELRRGRPSLPVLFMSGYTDAPSDDGAADPLLAKPFTPEQLRLATRRLLDARRAAPA